MKTRYSILVICLLALFATGCKKDNHRIRIFARNMTTSDSKVLVNPSSFDGGSWVAGESVLLYDDGAGTSGVYPIGGDNISGYYIDVTPAPAGPLSAFYPSGSFGGNDIDVSDAGIVLKRLTINFHSNYTMHDVAFPMMAFSDEENNNRLFFDHVTAGLKLTLTLDANSDPVNLASVKIVARNNSSVSNMSPGVCSWAVQGPTVPSGNIGIIGDQEVSYSSEMNFDFATEGVPGATVTSGGLSFCIPITVSSLNDLTVIGYSATGAELFRKTKSLTTPIQLECNTMYVLPTIEI